MSKREWVSLDTETTGLDYERHDVWEVAAVTESGEEYVWEFAVSLDAADAYSLRLNGYWERATLEPTTSPTFAYGWGDDRPRPPAKRIAHATAGPGLMEHAEAARDIYRVLDGRVVVASNPAFDFRMLGKRFREAGLPGQPMYHHPLDIKTLAWGYLLGKSKVGALHRDDSTDHLVDAAVGEDGWSKAFKAEGEHTALQDARWVATALIRIESPTFTFDPETGTTTVAP